MTLDVTNRVKMICKKRQKKSQVSCPFDYGNAFDEGLDDSGSKNILFNC